jgi:glycosyltransferase involved in cell wall biosynthesis
MDTDNVFFKNLSVVIPLRNMSGRLNNLFTEIRYLVAEDTQIILVDDGSSDDTSNEITDFILKNRFQEKIVFINAKFGGPGAARNVGKDKATRNWVCFWDADDKRNLDLMKATMNLTFDADLIITDFQKIYTVENLEVTKHRVFPFATHDLLVNGGLWRVVFNSKIIKNIDFLNLMIGEDLIFLARVLDLSPEISRISQVTYFYHVGQEAQITSGKFINKDALISINVIFGQLEAHKIRRNQFIAVVLVKLIKTSLRNQKWVGFKALIRIVYGGKLQNLVRNSLLIFYGLVLMLKIKALGNIVFN